jgi:hypothetical protein
MEKAAFSKQNNLVTNKLDLKEETSELLHFEHSLFTYLKWALRKVD